MLTLGIDPGTAIMGYGLVESGVSVSGEQAGAEELRLVEYGALRTPAHTPMPTPPLRWTPSWFSSGREPARSPATATRWRVRGVRVAGGQVDQLWVGGRTVLDLRRSLAYELTVIPRSYFIGVYHSESMYSVGDVTTRYGCCRLDRRA